MAENLKKKPSKGILKNSSSFDQETHQHQRKNKETKWDEMNIIATLHPPDKDYGHMKIDEPKTPYNYDEPDSSRSELDPNAVAEKLKSSQPPRDMEQEEEEDDDDDEEEDQLTPEEKALKKEFETKRKAHYNEYYAVKLARKLLEEEDEDESEEDNAGTSGKKK